MSATVLDSTMTCPGCDARSTERMPADACLFFWICTACGLRVKPKDGDCCVFCSYGSTACPPKQMERSCCT